MTDPIHEDSLSLLSTYKHISFDYLPEISREHLLNIIENYDGLIVRDRTKVTEDLLRKATRLKVVVRAGSGVDNIDLNTACSLGIKVLCVPSEIADSVAELTLGLMIMLSRKLFKAIESLKKGEWIKNQLMGQELKNKKVGIIGVGNIGRRVAKLTYSFGMKPLLNDVVKLDEDFVREVNAEVVALDDLLRESDYVTLHVPLTKNTEKMISERELKLMKKTAFLINTARGKLINYNALYRALTEGWIAAAALDVYEAEPPTDLKLLRLENVICTPHIGAQTIEARRRASLRAVQLVVEHLQTITCQDLK
ncbi:MAG: hydroxyacid dehydrogenase [Nitrososphaerota archaeon]